MTQPEDRREIDLSIEVESTPEAAWEAIATGPGVTAWMHHTEVEQRVGGRFAFDMGLGQGLNESGTVAGWQPHSRFATQGVRWEPSGGGPAALLATEWLIESTDQGCCVVRIVMSGFGSGQAWDDEIDSMTRGLRRSLELLQGHLCHSLTS